VRTDRRDHRCLVTGGSPGTGFPRCADDHLVQTFKAKIGTGEQAIPDSEALLEVGGGQLVIMVGDQRIGAWPVASLDLDLTNRGYRMNIEGEQLLVSPVDRFTFREAVDAEKASSTTQTRRRRRRSKAKAASTPKSPPVPSRRELKKAAKLERLRQEAAEEKAKLEAREEAKAEVRAQRKDGNASKRRFNVPSLRRSETPGSGPVEALLEPQPEAPAKREAPWEVPVAKEVVEVQKNRLITRVEDLPLPWKIGAGGALVALVIGIFLPRLVATLMLIPGLLAVMTAGLGLVDPGYTRKLPATLDEPKLLTIGGILLAVGLLVVTFF